MEILFGLIPVVIAFALAKPISEMYKAIFKIPERKNGTMSQANTQHSKNELDAYKPGGVLRREGTTAPKDFNEATFELIGEKSATMLANFFEDSESYFSGSGAELKYVVLINNSREVCFQLHFKERTGTYIAHDLKYTYNRLAKEERYDIVMSATDVQRLRARILSSFADRRPYAFMQSGRIYK